MYVCACFHYIFCAIISVHSISDVMYQVSENTAKNFESFWGQKTKRFPQTRISENNLASDITLYIYFPKSSYIDGYCYPYPILFI